MKKVYFFAQVFLLGTISVNAQVELNVFSDFGTSLYDINSSGNGLHGNGYYSFATNTSSVTEEGVGATVAINDGGKILGLIDDGTGTYNYIPALKVGETWTALAGFPSDYTYTFYDISENGKYIVGQTNWDENTGAWGFIYNTETSTFKLLSSTLYEYGSAYAVNNSGIAVGWVDDLPLGTVRMPAYFTEDGTITLISEESGEGNRINENNEIVGYLNSVPMYFKIGESAPISFSIPENMDSGSFTGISNNGVYVGYFQNFIPGTGFMRYPAIYHSSLGTNPILLESYLATQGITVTDFTGAASNISPNGNYVSGFGNGPAFMATGWALYLDDKFTLATQEISEDKISIYPNPVKEVLNIKGKNISNIEIYNFAGQKLKSAKNIESVHVSNLTKGAYLVKVTTSTGKIQTLKFIKE